MGVLPDLKTAIRGGCAALLLALQPMAGHAQDCEARLSADIMASDLIRLSFAQPCAPYAPVTVHYGPLTFGEETGLSGALDLDLPRLVKIDSLAVETSSGRFRTTVPSDPTSARYLAVIWTGSRPDFRLAVEGGAESTLGFPGMSPQVLLSTVPQGATANLDLAVNQDNCGRIIAFDLVDGGLNESRSVQVEMPACTRAGEVLRLPLLPSGR